MKRFTTLTLITILGTTACNPSNPLIWLGKHYQGGVVFFIDNTGKHGLIAAESDQSSGVKWSNGNDTVRTKAAGRVVGTGAANTDSLVAQLGPGDYAAMICHELSLNGYNDWFLPSWEELDLLYHQKGKIGGFANAWYWSSTDLLGEPALFAGNEDFTSGLIKLNIGMRKGSLNHVRAIRAF